MNLVIYILKKLKATIGDIYDDNIVDYELSPHGIEDFRIYNKTLTTVISDVAPVNTTKYHTLFMSGYKTSSATGVVANVNMDVNIDLEFYNLNVLNGGILKNIGNRTNEFNVLIHNNSYSNQDIISNKIIDAETNEILKGKYGFEWNKMEKVFEKNYYEGENIVLEISNLKIISDYSVSFDLTLKETIISYPVDIINKNNELVVRMNDTTTIVVSYFFNKVKYFKELSIDPLVIDIKKSFDIIIDKETNDVSFKVDTGESIVANVIDDLKIWYQFEDNKVVKNYSKSSYSNLELNIESNISFISSLSSDIDVDYASPYSYYTFLPGDHSFKVENEIKCDMLMVGGGGMKLKRINKTKVFEYTGSVEIWTKPKGVNEITAYVWGAGGSGGAYSTVFAGGSGAYIKTKINVSNYDNLVILVGQGGVYTPNTNSWTGGGIVSHHSTYPSGGGGGLSGIFVNNSDIISNDILVMNTTVPTAINSSAIAIVIAGSGGGGGGWMGGGGQNVCYGGGGGSGSLWDVSTGEFENKGQNGGDSGGNGGDANTLKATGGKHNIGGIRSGTNISGGISASNEGGNGGKYFGGKAFGVITSSGGAGWYGGGGGSDGHRLGFGGGGGSSYWGDTSLIEHIPGIQGTSSSTTPIGTITTNTYTIDASIGVGSSKSSGGNGLIILEYEVDVIDTLPSDTLKSPGGGGGEVKLYNELTLQPGDYTVTVGEGGYDTTLSSNSVVIYKALSGNLNNGGKAELNSNANPECFTWF